MMKLAIVGANGKVGTELCLLYKHDPDTVVIPVIRNFIGSAFLSSHDFECRIADVARIDDARGALSDADMVVIASYVNNPGRAGLAANRAIVENCVQVTKPSCKSIYFSTIRAFGRRVDPNTPRLAFPYEKDRRKRQLEKSFLRTCRRPQKPGIALRLGHVFGANQPRPARLRKLLAEHDVVRVNAVPDRASNVVHTVTVKECIDLFARTDIPLGVYSLVNVPQWTWSEVLEYYNSGARILFEDTQSPRRGLFQRLRTWLMKTAYAQRTRIVGAREFVPPALDRRLVLGVLIQKIRSDVAHLDESHVITIDGHEYAYRPIPGQQLAGLTETRTLLEETPELSF